MIKVRMSVFSGDDIVVTYRAYPFIYIRTIKEDEDIDDLDIFTSKDLVTKRRDVVDLIDSGKSFLISFQARKLAVAGPAIPAEALERAAAGGAKLKETLK
jgi:hypothetical protein